MPLRPVRRHAASITAAALLVGYVAVALASVRNKSTTSDEIVHLTAGYSYWVYHDYRLHPENGNLPQRWVALPLVLTDGLRFPDGTHPGWARSNMWAVGDSFFHDLGNPTDRMLFAARSAAVVFGVGVALQVYFWGRRLWGTGGGLLSLAVCVLCPTTLAHGPLATSDVCLTCFLLASVTAVWRVLQRVTRARLAVCALALGLLALAKHSAPLVAVMAAALVLIRVFAGPPVVVALGARERTVGSRRGRFGAALGAAAVCAAGALAILWAGYGFRFAAINTAELPPGRFAESMSSWAADMPVAWGVLRAAEYARVLPEAYTYGTAYVIAHRERYAFFLGEYSTAGWAGYFPYCFLVKTPWPLFGLLALAVLAVVRRPPAPRPVSGGGDPVPLWYRAAPLWVLWAVYWGFALTSTLNIGHRHILPTYPPLYILAGAAALWLARPVRAAGWAVVGLLVWSAGVTASAFPHYLAYFNPLLPPREAYTALVDSNLDWGQDLPLLRDRLATGDPRPAYLDYFGTGRPVSFGIQATTVRRPADPGVEGWRPGRYCVSATRLQAVYEPGRRDWTPELEATYRVVLELHRKLAAGEALPGGVRSFAEPEEREALRRLIAELQYIRLLIHLRNRRPDDTVGYSILVYDVGEEELREVLEGRPKTGPLAPYPLGRGKWW